MAGKSVYGVKELFWISLMLMLLPLKSRRQYREELNFDEPRRNLEKMFNLKLPRMPHGDTLSYLWKRLSVPEVGKIRHLMIKKLLRGKHLEKFRYMCHYLIAVDGTEYYRSNERHCAECLYSEKDGKRQYYHRVFEAKLVCSNGFAFSIETEFIDNAGKGVDDKQDCELKAFQRLSEKLKKMFPRLPVIILGDGLFPTGPDFNICRKNKWHYMFVLKDGSLKTVWEDFWGLCNMGPNALNVMDKPQRRTVAGITYQWQNSLSYEGKDFNGTVNLLVLTGESGNIMNAFITDMDITEKNCVKLAEHGKMRWKIENEGFNVQKNSAYELEHLYTKDPDGMKIVYYFIQIAHILNQLFLNADLLKACKEYKTDRSCLTALLTGLKLLICEEEIWRPPKIMKYQARWP